jgi:S-formylglutathione hydrolase
VKSIYDGLSIFMKQQSLNKCFGGRQGVYSHQSTSTGTGMTFAVYEPPQARDGPVPVFWFLSGLTCSHENAMVKAGMQEHASRLGMAVVLADTSPRGEGVADDRDGAYDFGLGAGFYVDATQEPFARHYQMYSYIVDELPELIGNEFDFDMDRQGICGHSMGGHGALTIGLKNPGRFKSISAFSPIVSPMNCPWGEKALGGYLGDDRSTWAAYDACALVADAPERLPLLVDQGDSDDFLVPQLKSHLLTHACQSAGHRLTLRMQQGYDHSYFFISTFMKDHMEWHSAAF